MAGTLRLCLCGAQCVLFNGASLLLEDPAHVIAAKLGGARRAVPCHATPGQATGPRGQRTGGDDQGGHICGGEHHTHWTGLEGCECWESQFMG